MNYLDDSIFIWSVLADEAERLATYEESRGSSGSAWRNKAMVYRQTVRAIELERETGVAHCSCHLQPLKACEPPKAR